MLNSLSNIKTKSVSWLIFNLNRLRFMLTWPARRKYKVMSFDDTIQHLITNRSSVARFGDGELNYAIKAVYDIHTFSSFQGYNEKICKRLHEVLTTGMQDRYNILISVVGAPLNKGTKGFMHVPKEFWQIWVRNRLKYLIKILNPEIRYGEAAFTRFYMLHKDKSQAPARFAKIKRLWDGDDLLIVEGAQSRLGVGNDVFDNARSIRRILCPPTDAFSRYDDIFSAVKNNARKTDTIVLALGQTATVMAYDLAKAGYRALDLGHIDIEYEWMRMGATEKVPVPGKFTNEARGGQDVKDIVDEEYMKQIIHRI